MPVIKVSRSYIIPASKQEVFTFISDFRYFPQFNMWYLEEPNANIRQSQETSGIGAWHEWEGKYIGAGRLTIEDISPDNSNLTMRLDFTRPRSSNNKVFWHLEEQVLDGKVSCKTTWKSDLRISWFLFPIKGFMQKMFNHMVGAAYSMGLVRLSHLINKNEPKLDLKIRGAIDFEQKHFVGLHYSNITITHEAMKKVTQEAYPPIYTLLKERGITPQESFMGYQNQRMNNGVVTSDLIVGVFVPEHIDVENQQGVSLYSSSIPAGAYAKISHEGSYSTLHYGWQFAMMFTRKARDKASAKRIHLEIYETMPDSHPNDASTQIFIPINAHKQKYIQYGR